MDKNKFLKEVGFNIKIARMRKKLSQETLAELADCSMSYIGFIERGETSASLYNFVKIAKTLDLDINDFLAKIEKN